MQFDGVTAFCWECGGAVEIRAMPCVEHPVSSDDYYDSLRCVGCDFPVVLVLRYNAEIGGQYRAAYRSWRAMHGCEYCGEVKGRHVNGKCLFDSTTYHGLTGD